MIVSLEMVLPAFAGLWIDRRLGTQFVFLLIGLALGCFAAGWQLIRLLNRDRQERDRETDR
jgi:hypothetical protein